MLKGIYIMNWIKFANGTVYNANSVVAFRIEVVSFDPEMEPEMAELAPQYEIMAMLANGRWVAASHQFRNKDYAELTLNYLMGTQNSYFDFTVSQEDA